MSLSLGTTNAGVVVGCLISLWAARTYMKYRRLMHRMGGAPGPKTFFSAATLFTRFLPNIPGINRKAEWLWKQKYATFQQCGQDILAAITLYPSPRALVSIVDPKRAKEVTIHRSAFPKPVQFYKPFEYFGANTLTTEGAEWQIHRKVVAKSFTEQNNKLVWKETVDAMLELFTLWEADGQGEEACVQDVSELTRDITLMIISAAAFGMKTPWKDDQPPPHGHAMTFKETILQVGVGFIHRIVLPDWALKLYPFGRKTYTAYAELEAYMREMIENRIMSPHQHEDLFSNLIKAREEEKDGKAIFSDSDLVGNLFILLFAGHETSANTLSFALAFLALYPEVQERFLAQIRQVIGPGRLPAYTDISKLTYGTAIMQETLRMVPIVAVIPKSSAFDTQFVTQREGGELCEVPVPAGTPVVINVVGLHYNPKYWKDPFEFRPERFLTEYEKYAWLPFSAGLALALVKGEFSSGYIEPWFGLTLYMYRFAEIEILTVLTLLVMRYEIQVTEDPRFASETLEERRARVLDAELASTHLMRARKIPLTFRRR